MVMTLARPFPAPVPQSGSAAALDAAGFAPATLCGRPLTYDTVAGFSIATTAWPVPGSLRCNSASSDAEA